jgi:hypothetical protein
MLALLRKYGKNHNKNNRILERAKGMNIGGRMIYVQKWGADFILKIRTCDVVEKKLTRLSF